MILLIGAVVLGVLVLYSVTRTALLISESKRLVENTAPFEKVSADISVPLLVLGDSTAVGVGATVPEESVPGRVAIAIGATHTENHAVVGAKVKDLSQQIGMASLPKYRLILIQIGANDMVRFHDAGDAASTLGTALESLPPADQVIVISAGDLGTARILPLPLRSSYSRINQAYHSAFSEAAARHGAIYVDLSQGPGSEAFAENPAPYFAPDQFHLSSEGYRLWFEAIQPHLP